jgi:hypothetical protein
MRDLPFRHSGSFLVRLCHKAQEAALCKDLSRSHAPRGNAYEGLHLSRLFPIVHPGLHSHAERWNEGSMRIHELRDTVGLGRNSAQRLPLWIPAFAGMTI